jgi:hypothetical protein
VPDLGHTQAEWTHFVGEEEGYCWLVAMRDLEEMANRLLLERVRVQMVGDRDGNVAALDLAGVIYGTNTDARGRIYMRFTANGGNWDVDLYKATGAGAGNLVAHVDNLADGGTSALTADNSSGITGTITLGAAVVAVAADTVHAKTFVDFRLVAKAFETDADSVSDENASASYKAMIEAYTAAGNAVRSALTGFIASFARFAISDQGTPVAKGRTFLESADASVFTESQRRDSDGNVVVDQSGLLVTQRVDMLAETTGGTQDVVRRVPAAGAGSFPASNAGSGSIASHTPSEAALEMTITGRCVRGVDTGALGQEQFEISYNYLDKGQRRVVTAPVNLQVGKSWTGPLGIGPIELVRTYSKTGDGSNLNLAAATGGTAPTVTGENNSNTDEGVLYWQIVDTGANWDVEFYSSSTYGDTTLVAKATNVATGAAMTASSQNGSGLTIAWTVGSAPVDATQGTFLLNPFKVQNSSRIADSFTIDVTIGASPGAFQSTVVRMFPGAYLNSTASGGESISDDYVKAGFQEFVDSNP